MTEKKAFCVLLRALGVYFLIHGVEEFWLVAARSIWPQGLYKYPVPQDVIYSLFILVLGYSMARWPFWVSRIVWTEDLS